MHRFILTVIAALVMAPADAGAYGGAHVGTTRVGPTGAFHAPTTVAAARGADKAVPRRAPNSVFFGGNQAIHYSPTFQQFGYSTNSHGNVGVSRAAAAGAFR